MPGVNRPPSSDEAAVSKSGAQSHPRGDISPGQKPRGARHRTWQKALANKWLLRAAALATFLAVWEWALGEGRVDPTFAAPPTKVIRAIPEVLSNDLLPGALLATLKLFALGFLLSAVIGVLLGFLMARVAWLDAALSPFVNGLYASPLPALVPIITAILGYALTSKLLIVVLLGVFPILINANQGAKDTDPGLLEVAGSFGASERVLWRDVVLPFSVPYLVIGARQGAARALIGTVVAEIYASPDGLGYLILTYGSRFNMDAMLVVVLMFTLMGLTLSLGIQLIERRFSRWRTETA